MFILLLPALDRAENEWCQAGFDLDAEARGDKFGSSIAMSSDGNHVTVDAVGNDTNGSNSGHVRVFEWRGGPEWQQVGTDLDGEASFDNFGCSISLSSYGNRVAIGGYLHDENELKENSGHVRIFDWVQHANEWQQVGVDMYGEAAGDKFGASVALSSDGNRVVVGATFNDGNGQDSGHARIFEISP